MPSTIILLDDGQFYMELNCNYPANEAPGNLCRRTHMCRSTCCSFDAIGGFNKNHSDGTWEASVDMQYDPENDSDSRILFSGGGRLDAIVALWQQRYYAWAHN